MRLFALLLLLPLAACTEAPSVPLSPEDAAERDSVLALLRAADTAALAAAFDRLDAFRYRVETRTEQLGTDGRTEATRTVAAEVTPNGGVPLADVVQADSTGAFDYGGFALFASEPDIDPLPAENPATLVVPEDPAYLDPRGIEAYQFRFASDTRLGDRRVRVLSIDARPGEGDDKTLRHAQLYLDPATGDLVGIRLQQRMTSLLFSERSDATILLQPGPAGGWLPQSTRFETTLDALFTAKRHFRLSRRYSEFAPAAAAAR
ncbi:MAG: hypothetical protein ABJF88_04800 [Rhodothermales bacterium]